MSKYDVCQVADQGDPHDGGDYPGDIGWVAGHPDDDRVECDDPNPCIYWGDNLVDKRRPEFAPIDNVREAIDDAKARLLMCAVECVSDVADIDDSLNTYVYAVDDCGEGAIDRYEYIPALEVSWYRWGFKIKALKDWAKEFES